MYLGKKVLILGLGISGKAAARFLQKRGARVWGVDRDTTAGSELQGAEILPDTAELDMHAFDLVVTSPGIPPSHPLYKKALKEGIEIIGEFELACSTIQQPMIGITGTNGKTTVTLLIEHVLNTFGRKAKALGNIGFPITAELDQNLGENEIIVAEISSFQLETLKSKVFDCGLILNITPDHLDRYLSMQEYAQAKLKMKDHLKKDGKLYIEEQAAHQYHSLLGTFSHYKTYGYSSHNAFYTDLEWFYLEGKKAAAVPSSLKHQKSHDLENAIAAMAACYEFNVSPDHFLKAFATFKKPAHRIEFIKNYKGVNFFDDSKGTNLDAVIRAVECMQGSVVLIAGGVDKGAPYIPWLSSFNGKVKGICAIGQAASKIKDELSHSIPVYLCSNLNVAVEKAFQLACPGENVLLSPGCSSYDMFKSYAHRGEEFQRVVNQLCLSGEVQ